MTGIRGPSSSSVFTHRQTESPRCRRRGPPRSRRHPRCCRWRTTGVMERSSQRPWSLRNGKVVFFRHDLWRSAMVPKGMCLTFTKGSKIKSCLATFLPASFRGIFLLSLAFLVQSHWSFRIQVSPGWVGKGSQIVLLLFVLQKLKKRWKNHQIRPQIPLFKERCP